MLDYTNKWMSEFIKSVKVLSGENDTEIINVLDVEKKDGVVSEKEVWPGAAAKFAVQTNYDFDKQTKQLVGSAYSGPVLTHKKLLLQSLAMTISPYPKQSKWKLEHSPNIKHIQAFDEIYAGEKTINLQIEPADGWHILGEDEIADEPEFCWINVVPATAESVSNSPQVRFYLEPSYKEEQQDQEEDDSPPLLQWKFDNLNNPLKDEISGKSLANYKNRYSLDPMLMASRIGNGYNNFAVKAVLVGSESNCIVVDDVIYVRASEYDQPDSATAKYCWKEIDEQQLSVYTTLSGDLEASAPVYGQDGTPTGHVISEQFTTDSNYYCCNTGIDVSDPDKDFTLSFYFKYHLGFEVGFLDYLRLDDGYYTMTPSIASQKNFSGMWNTRNFDVRGKNAVGGWRHISLTRTRQLDATDPALAYTEENKRGFIVKYGVYVHNAGYPYVRDPEKDMNGKYAFTWTDGGLTDNTTPPTLSGDALPTVWLPTEAPSDDVDAFASDGVTQITKASQLNPYCAEYRDDVNIPEKPYYSEDPGRIVICYGKKYTGRLSECSVFKDGSQNFRIGYVYENGRLINVGAIKYVNNWQPAYGDLLVVRLKANSGTTDETFDGIDNLCLYDRFPTNQELKIIQEEFPEGDQTEKNPQMDISYRTQQALKKIKVNDSWYCYNPDLTYYSPTPEDDKAAKFGWQKMTGDGIEQLWTSTIYDGLTVNAQCIIERGGVPQSDYKIQEIQPITLAEMPFRCDLVPYVIDDRTVAVSICTHDEVIRTARRMFPGLEAIAYNSENGYLTGYGLGYTLNCLIWRSHKYCQEEICRRADTASAWVVDGNNVEIRSRGYIAPYEFKVKAVQWRNCQPGDKWYAAKPIVVPGDGRAPDIMQIAYLTLPEPMTDGSTHTIEWCGNTCQFTYGKEFACSTIKINQEGYLPWAKTKRAYLGRWLGASETGPESYMPAAEHRQFRVIQCIKSNIDDFALSGIMTQRCTAGTKEESGNPARVCSDRYGQGGRANRPMTGENVFEIDFSGISSVYKDAIVAGGQTYFRDDVEDYLSGTITVNGTIYSRMPDNDTCNAYAWCNSGADVSVMYTDTHIPATTEKARLGYDDYDQLFDIENVVAKNMLGWTTERIVETDYGESETIWTEGLPSIGSSAIKADGTALTIQQKLNNQLTQDIAGFYQIYVPGIGWSFKFLIHPQAYFHAYYVAQRGLFHQRSGCAQVRHPYTNWEYMGPGHELLFEGNFCPFASLANNTNAVYQVDPDTLEPVLAEDGTRIQLSQSGAHFAQNSQTDKYDTQPMYGVYGGWFDAADFDMREVHIPVVRQLAEAYILFPDNFSDRQCDLPESGDGIPDILNEAMWGAQLWMRSQERDGGIHGWFETNSHESDWPWESKKKYYCCCTSLRHSVSYAASAASLAKALLVAANRASTPEIAEKIREYAKVYTESACAAFTYGTKELYDLYMKLPDTDRGPSSYFKALGRMWAFIEWTSPFNEDNNPRSGFKSPFGMDMFKAACALYTLTHEKRFRDYINDDTVTSYISTFGKDFALNTTDDVLWEFIYELRDEFPEFTERIHNKYISYADEWIGYQNKHPYRWFWLNPGHKYIMNCLWGSAHPDCRAGGLLAAWLATKNEKYRDALISAFDYVYGCNNLGRSWVAGSGHVYHVSHLDSWLPRHTLRNGLRTSRPGISMYYMGHNELPDYKIRKGWVGLEFEGRSDQDCPSLACNAIPAMVKQVSNGWDNWYFDRVPYTSAGQLHGSESLHVACFEYTVWETISRKAMMLGMLMGKHNKPKFWYKQPAPKDLQGEIRNFSFLP